jgi:hypothetical protein
VDGVKSGWQAVTPAMHIHAIPDRSVEIRSKMSQAKALVVHM